MAMLRVNGAAILAPSAMKAAIFDISSGVNRNAKGNAVVDRRAVKRRLELAWAHLEGEALAQLLQAMDGFFTVSYPDPESGAAREMCCYCSERSVEMLRMDADRPIWIGVKMTWTER